MNADSRHKIKLIVPPYLQDYAPYATNPQYYLPYGMGILTSFLRQHGHHVAQEDLSIKINRHKPLIFSRFKDKDLDLKRNKVEIREFLECGRKTDRLGSLIDNVLDMTSIRGFDLIGFSVLSYLHFLFALALSKRIKQITNIPIVFGGAFISLYGPLYQKALNIVDYMVAGDGRIPLLKLIDYAHHKISISEVPGLSYKEKGLLVTTPKFHSPIEDIPAPDFSGLSMKLYENSCLGPAEYGVQLPYQISSGCAGNCSFCIRNQLNNKLEFKSYEKVISELIKMKKTYKSHIFYFCDNSINNSYEYLEGLCDLFIKNKLDIKWKTFAKVGNLDKHILKKMKEAGCYWLYFGIESGSDRILQVMNKGFTSEQATQALRDSADAGIINHPSFIAGYPHETQEDIRQSMNFIKKNGKYIHHIAFYKLELNYGSALYFNPKQYNITNLTPTHSPYSFGFDEINGLTWEQKQRQQNNSYQQMLKAIRRYVGIKNIVFALFYYLKSSWMKFYGRFRVVNS